MTPASESRAIELLERIVAALERDAEPPSVLMPAAEVARTFAIDVRTLRRLRHLGEVPEPIKLGSAVRWRRADVERFLQEKKP